MTSMKMNDALKALLNAEHVAKAAGRKSLFEAARELRTRIHECGCLSLSDADGVYSVICAVTEIELSHAT